MHTAQLVEIGPKPQQDLQPFQQQVPRPTGDTMDRRPLTTVAGAGGTPALEQAWSRPDAYFRDDSTEQRSEIATTLAETVAG